MIQYDKCIGDDLFNSQKICFGILNKTSILEDSCFYSSVPAEAVTIAILKDASSHSWCCLMNRNVKLKKNSVSIRTVCDVKLQQMFAQQSFDLDTDPQFFYTLFEVSPEIRRLGASSHYCCYGNYTASSKPNFKTFYRINWELNKVSLY